MNKDYTMSHITDKSLHGNKVTWTAIWVGVKYGQS